VVSKKWGKKRYTNNNDSQIFRQMTRAVTSRYNGTFLEKHHPVTSKPRY
jgi:hypothetical protein